MKKLIWALMLATGLVTPLFAESIDFDQDDPALFSGCPQALFARSAVHAMELSSTGEKVYVSFKRAKKVVDLSYRTFLFLGIIRPDVVRRGHYIPIGPLLAMTEGQYQAKLLPEYHRIVRLLMDILATGHDVFRLPAGLEGQGIEDPWSVSDLTHEIVEELGITSRREMLARLPEIEKGLLEVPEHALPDFAKLATELGARK